VRDQDEPTAPAPDLGRESITVQLLRASDPEGLQRLLLDHGGLVKSRLRKDFGTILDDSELDEAMGAMVVKVWHAAPRFDSAKGTLRAWALVIARNCALRLLEARRRTVLRSEYDLDTLAMDAIPAQVPSPERQRLLADLHICIEKLPPLQQAVLKADLDAGTAAPAEQLAKRLGTTANSIYVSRLKGRKALRLAMLAMGHTLLGSPPAAPKPKAIPTELKPGEEHG
jgi:RNA polymerase sigma factor (sigma-70 family)